MLNICVYCGSADGTEPHFTKAAEELGQRIGAAGTLIRSGFEPADALRAVGLDPIKHLGLLPVTLVGE